MLTGTRHALDAQLTTQTMRRLSAEVGLPAPHWARVCVAAARGQSRRELLLEGLKRCQPAMLSAVLQAYDLFDLSTAVEAEDLPPEQDGVHAAAASALARTVYRAPLRWRPLLGLDGGGLLGTVDGCEVEALIRRQYTRAAKCSMEQVRSSHLHHWLGLGVGKESRARMYAPKTTARINSHPTLGCDTFGPRTPASAFSSAAWCNGYVSDNPRRDPRG